MENEKKNSFLQLYESVNSLPVPGWIKKNILIALAKGIGNLAVSALDWPTAWFEAKARELRAKAKGNETVQESASQEVANLFKLESELAERATNYYAEQIISKQLNREEIALKLFEELPNHISNKDDSDANTDHKQIDDDWLTTFWSISESKTSAELKMVLAKILAKEVTEPNSISPITLQMIAVLTSDIGIAFHKLCNLSICSDNIVYVIHPNIGPFMTAGELSDYGISWDEQAELEGIGLIRSMNVSPVCITPEGEDFSTCDYAGTRVKTNFSKGVKIIDFTRAGREIRNLLELKPNDKYTEYLKSFGPEQFQIIE